MLRIKYVVKNGENLRKKLIRRYALKGKYQEVDPRRGEEEGGNKGNLLRPKNKNGKKNGMKVKLNP